MAHHLYEGECDIVRLAALLWRAVSMAHGYEDGNKRSAFLLMTVFLEVNGVELVEDSAYPGHFINRCFDCGDFTVETLDTFLRSRCRWVAGS
ncbi:Fic family protein [Pseudodonghicola xiamenensis]|uniref:Fic family protein n=1 Tax=Pseudodonghicola xiamenensis TaxID=337702 RepID=UPI000685367D